MLCWLGRNNISKYRQTLLLLRKYLLFFLVNVFFFFLLTFALSIYLLKISHTLLSKFYIIATSCKRLLKPAKKMKSIEILLLLNILFPPGMRRDKITQAPSKTLLNNLKSSYCNPLRHNLLSVLQTYTKCAELK